MQLASGKVLRVATFVNKVLNGDCTSAFADRMRRTASISGSPNVKLTDEAKHGVLPSTPFGTLLTYTAKGKIRITSAAILSYVKCQLENRDAVVPDAKTLVQCTYFTSFIEFDAHKLISSGRFGRQISVPVCGILFAELDLATDGGWILEKGTLDVFLTTTRISRRAVHCSRMHIQG